MLLGPQLVGPTVSWVNSCSVPVHGMGGHPTSGKNRYFIEGVGLRETQASLGSWLPKTLSVDFRVWVRTEAKVP